MPMNRTDRPGSTSSGMPVWCRPMTPWSSSPVRIDEDRAGPAAADRDLVAGQHRHAAPGRTPGVRPTHRRRVAGRGPGGALAAERGDGLRVGQEEPRTCGAGDSSSSRSSGVGGPVRVWMRCLEVGVVQQPELAVVDQLVLLALAQRLDGEPQLLLDLVHRLVVEVGDAGVHPQDRLRDAQLVLAGRGLVVDEGARQRRARRRARRPARSRPRRALFCGVLGLVRHCSLRARARRRTLVDQLASNASRGSASTVHAVTALTVKAQVLAPLEQHAVAEVVAVGQHAERGLVAVLAGAELLRPCRARCRYDRSAGCPASRSSRPASYSRCSNRSAERGAAPSASSKPRSSGSSRQLLRDDLHLGADVDEAHPAVAHGVGEPPVDPVRAARHLHPRQHAQQPAGGDALHLRHGLGGGRQWRAARCRGWPRCRDACRGRRLAMSVSRAADLDVLQDAQRVGHQHGGGDSRR